MTQEDLDRWDAYKRINCVPFFDHRRGAVLDGLYIKIGRFTTLNQLQRLLPVHIDLLHKEADRRGFRLSAAPGMRPRERRLNGTQAWALATYFLRDTPRIPATGDPGAWFAEFKEDLSRRR